VRFWKRENGRLEAELRASRPAPSDEFVRSLARHVETRSRNRTLYRLSRVSFAAAVTVLMLGTLASFGGLSYAASAPAKAVDAVRDAVSSDTRRVVQGSSAQAQYAPQKVTICHVLPNGREITLSVAEAAVAAHLRHGDYLGRCNGTGGVAGAGGGSDVTGGGGTGGALAGTQAGTLPFTGLSLAGTVLLSGVLMGTGFVLRRRATAID
jgi:hypothetical protein